MNPPYLPAVVYVAGPFRSTNDDGTANQWQQEQNIRRAEALALDVWKAGFAAVCPHANTRFYQGSADDRIWLDGDLAILARCDAILMTPDWARSSGATAERAFAIAHGIPVLDSLDDLNAWRAARAE
jgi:nucleoside 2-deoxyribosyltransferase